MTKKTWECPICTCNAYQRYGGVPLKMKKIDKNGNETDTIRQFGQYFMCKGCSIFFSNPNLFNADMIAKKIIKISKLSSESTEVL